MPLPAGRRPSVPEGAGELAAGPPTSRPRDNHDGRSIDGMKRLASRLTWWPVRPHKSTPAVNAAERKG
jgi:hypothetical protein